MVTIVLIEPQTSGNIGSIARVMANFGFKDLVLINPKCEIDEDSKRFAKNAQAILKNVKIKKIDYLKSFSLVIGTTSKTGREFNITRTPLMPDAFAKKISEIKSKKVALVLGREGDGLYNHEIELCDFIVTIPTSKEYDSMNISHSLAILLYELKKDEYSMEILSKYTPMSARDKEQILIMLDSAIKKLDFVTEEKKETQRKLWKRMITKAVLTKREAFVLMGFLKKIK